MLGTAEEMHHMRKRGVKVFQILRPLRGRGQGSGQETLKKEAAMAPEHSQAVPTLRHHIHAREPKKDTGQG
jgi:hypothetical protein